jgi:hypothetical protein
MAMTNAEITRRYRERHPGRANESRRRWYARYKLLHPEIGSGPIGRPFPKGNIPWNINTPNPIEKTCCNCGLIKPAKEFKTRPSRNGRLNSTCRDCDTLYQRQYRADHPEITKAAANRWRKKNPEKVIAIERRKIYKRLGLTLEEAMAILSSQEYRCANPGCRIRLKWGKGSQSANLDHDHSNGKPRAFLCASCNRGLGHLRENPDLIRGLATYLEEWNAKIHGSNLIAGSRQEGNVGKE